MGGAKSPRRVYSKPMKKEMESTFDMRTNKNRNNIIKFLGPHQEIGHVWQAHPPLC